MILLDTSGLFAALDQAAPEHAAARASFESAEPPLVMSPLVLAELDYLLTERLGPAAELRFLDEVAEGRYTLADFKTEDVASANAVLKRYADLNIGLADASIVVLAERHGTRDVLTLDERHFRALRVGRKRFRLLPADA